MIKPLEKSANDTGIKTSIAILDDESRSKLETIIDYIEKNNIDLVVVGSEVSHNSGNYLLEVLHQV